MKRIIYFLVLILLAPVIFSCATPTYLLFLGTEFLTTDNEAFKQKLLEELSLPSYYNLSASHPLLADTLEVIDENPHYPRYSGNPSFGKLLEDSKLLVLNLGLGGLEKSFIIEDGNLRYDYDEIKDSLEIASYFTSYIFDSLSSYHTKGRVLVLGTLFLDDIKTLGEYTLNSFFDEIDKERESLAADYGFEFLRIREFRGFKEGKYLSKVGELSLISSIVSKAHE